MKPAMQIAKTLTDAVEWFEKLPDDFQDADLAEKVTKCLDEWKREAEDAVKRTKDAR